MYINEIYGYRNVTTATTMQTRDTVFIDEEEFSYRTEQFCLKIANGETVELSASIRARPMSNAQDAPDIRLPAAGYDKKLNKLRQILLLHQ